MSGGLWRKKHLPKTYDIRKLAFAQAVKIRGGNAVPYCRVCGSDLRLQSLFCTSSMFVGERAAAGAVARFRVLVAHRVDLEVSRVAHMTLVVLAIVDAAFDFHTRRLHYFIPFQQMFRY